MLLLTSAALPQLQQHRHPNLGRLITPAHFPRLADTLAQGFPVAADNGCFVGLDAPAIAKMMRGIAPLPTMSARIVKAWAHHNPKMQLAEAPPDGGSVRTPGAVRGRRDVGRGVEVRADATLALPTDLPDVHPGFLWMAIPDVVGRSDETFELFREWHVFLCHLPLAFVLQNGSERPGHVPWDAPGLAAVFVGGTDEWRYGVDAADLVREARGRSLHVHFGRISSRRLIRYAASIGATSFDSSRYSRWRDQLLPEGLERARQPPNLRLLP